jgi:3-hydroxyisobutyrate dehydrogenase-like beta-hydroxyacid dehydrogenase
MSAPGEKVGVVGLGLMGGPISRHLAAAGFQTAGFDLDAGRRAAAAAEGVTAFAELEGLLGWADVILTSLPSAAAARSVADALARLDDRPRLLVELSTLSLEDKLEVALRVEGGGHQALDCPISGTGAQAQVRDLVVFASGEAAAVDRALPILRAFSRAAEPVGAYGAGTKLKLIANLLVAIHNVATAEAISVGVRAGIDPARLVELIAPGAGGSRIFSLRGPMMAAETFEPATMKLSVWDKDMRVIAKFVEALGCSTPLFDATGPLYRAALEQGLGELDTAAVYEVLRAARRGNGGNTPPDE